MPSIASIKVVGAQKSVYAERQRLAKQLIDPKAVEYGKSHRGSFKSSKPRWRTYSSTRTLKTVAFHLRGG